MLDSFGSWRSVLFGLYFVFEIEATSVGMSVVHIQFVFYVLDDLQGIFLAAKTFSSSRWLEILVLERVFSYYDLRYMTIFRLNV